jgi:hypothetical protein
VATFTTQLDAQLRSSTITQIAAFAFGVLVGMVFWLILVSDPPTLAALATAFGALTGAILTGAIDVLSTARNKRAHVGLYIIGLLIGAFVMIALINWEVVDTLNIPESSGSPAG